jgi:hypothetical protein
LMRLLAGAPGETALTLPLIASTPNAAVRPPSTLGRSTVARLRNEKLDNADITASEGYIHSVIDAVEVDDRPSHPDHRQPPSLVTRPRTEMFVVLYANGAPDEIRTLPSHQIVSLVCRGLSCSTTRQSTFHVVKVRFAPIAAVRKLTSFSARPYQND